jgi:hypothetical protein
MLQNVFNYSTRDVNERNISDDPVVGHMQYLHD